MGTIVFRSLLLTAALVTLAVPAWADTIQVISRYDPVFEAGSLTSFGTVSHFGPTGSGNTLYWYTEVRDGLFQAIEERVLQSVVVGTDGAGNTTFSGETEVDMTPLGGPGTGSEIQVAGGSLFMGDATNGGATHNIYEYGFDGAFDGLLFGGPINDPNPGQSQSLRDPENLAYDPATGDWFMNLGPGDGSVMSIYKWNAGAGQWDVEIDVTPFTGATASSTAGIAHANGELWAINNQGTRMLQYSPTIAGDYDLTIYDIDDQGLGLDSIQGLGFGPNGNFWAAAFYADDVQRIIELEAPFDSSTPAPIPEPSTLVLGAVGGLGLALRGWASRKR